VINITGNEVAELASTYLGGEFIESPLLLINDCLLDLGEDSKTLGNQT